MKFLQLYGFFCMCLHMDDQGRTWCCRVTTCLTFERFFTSMCPNIFCQTRFLYTTKITWVRFKRPFTSMCSYMALQKLNSWWFIVTKFAPIPFLLLFFYKKRYKTMFLLTIISKMVLVNLIEGFAQYFVQVLKILLPQNILFLSMGNCITLKVSQKLLSRLFKLKW